MRIAQLDIKNFRGIKNTSFNLEDYSVLVGPNSCGKSTIIDALALVFSRDRMVRHLTEHDFYGSNPVPEQRINIIVTLIDFKDNDPDLNSDWFREGRAVPKWFNHQNKLISPIKSNPTDLLCAQIGFSARFDHEELIVELIRYFHDDDEIEDPFNDESIVKVSASLLNEVGFFLVPASRTWDRMVSFSSELFRRVVTAMGQVPSEVILNERNRLRSPENPLEKTGELGVLIQRINNELGRFFPNSPQLQLRITGTDCESLLNSIVPHYQCSWGHSLPAGRHGTGLLSLQTLMLLLEFGRFRKEQNKNFILAVEEPEIHLPPGLQRILMHRIESVTDQAIITTHSPSIAAFYPPTKVMVLENRQGNLVINPLVKKPLSTDTINGIRKLLRDNRFDTISALMHEWVLIPEGRIDFEWFRLLSTYTETKEGWEMAGGGSNVPFSTIVGVIPTHDATVGPTFELLSAIRSRLMVLVDGDADGNRYINEILKLSVKPNLIIQWPNSWTIENVLYWIMEPKVNEIVNCINQSLGKCISDGEELIIALKTSSPSGLKQDYQAYEYISGVIADYPECLSRAKQLLDALCAIALRPNDAHPQFNQDQRSIEGCQVLVWTP